MGGFCNVRISVYVGFLMCGRVYLCFLMRGYVYVWVL